MKITNRPSSLHRRKLCPGSGRMEAAIPDHDDESRYSAEGTLLHEYFADKKRDRGTLSPAHQDLMARADQLETILFQKVEADAGIQPGTAYRDNREETLAFFVEGQKQPLFTGTTDLIRIYECEPVVAVVVDLKMGFLDVDAAADNLQLAAYATMGAQYMSDMATGSYSISGWPLERVFCAIIQPRADFEKRLTIASYSPEELNAAHAAIVAIDAASREPDAPLVPSPEACRYCSARFDCCVSLAPILAVAEMEPKPLVASLDSDTLGKLMDVVKMANAESFGKAIMKEGARRIAAGEMPGWLLEENGSTREITSVSAAFQRFQEKFATHSRYADGEKTIEADFLGTLKPTMGKLEALMHLLLGGTLAAAKREFYLMIEDLIVRNPKAPTPTRDKTA